MPTRPEVSAADRRHPTRRRARLQILNYATAAGVEWVALTDGNEWRIYNSHATVPVEQKLFRVVRISEPDTRAEETLRLLAKAQMADHLIDDLWKSDFVDRQIRDALLRLFGPEPESSLVRLVRSKTPVLSPSEVRKSLGRLRTTFDFPLVAAPVSHRFEHVPEPQQRVPKPASPDRRRAYSQRTPVREPSTSSQPNVRQYASTPASRNSIRV